MKSTTKAVRFGSVIGLGLMTMAGGAQAGGPTCDGPIQLGSVPTITGPVDFSAGPKATAAFFNKLNAAGGINGCQIAYEIADDRGDPLVATQAARNLIDNNEVVAMVRGASLLDCGVNAALYQRSNVLDVAGLGVDPVCYTSPSVSAVHPGPYTLSTAMLYFASQELGAEKVCAFNYVIGGWKEAMENALKDWEVITGQKLQVLDMTLPVQGDLTPYLIRARDEGCDAVFANLVEPGIVQWINTAASLASIGLAVVLTIAVEQFLGRTRTGLQLRALSEKPMAAELLGIPVRRLAIGVWALSGAVTTLALMLIAPLRAPDFGSLSLLVVPTFAAALVGAFNSFRAALFGGLLIGLASGFVGLNQYRAAVPFLVILTVLLWSQRGARWDEAR